MLQSAKTLVSNQIIQRGVRGVERTVDLCPRGEGGIVGERLDNVVIRAIHVSIFLDEDKLETVSVERAILQTYTGQDAIQPVQHLFWYTGHAGVGLTLWRGSSAGRPSCQSDATGEGTWRKHHAFRHGQTWQSSCSLAIASSISTCSGLHLLFTA